LHLLDKSVQVDKLALLERVVLGETHLLELGLALSELVLMAGISKPAKPNASNEYIPRLE
jgi:hypothetical protein